MYLLSVRHYQGSSGNQKRDAPCSPAAGLVRYGKECDVSQEDLTFLLHRSRKVKLSVVAIISMLGAFTFMLDAAFVF